MNKIITIGVASLLALAPFMSQAADYSRFEGRYDGAWDDTYDSCGDTAQSGDLLIRLNSVASDGTISNASVKFDDSTKIMATSGRIYRHNGVRRIRLNYGSTTDGTVYTIKAKLTNHRHINGRYDHANTSCTWGGTVVLKHS